LIAGAAGLLAAPAVVRAAGAGVALVIGNSKYQWEAQLPNVRRDAPDVAKHFRALGLQTELVQDAGRAQMDQAIQKFGAASQGANFSAFYFAGHGATWERIQYLVPVDSDLSNPETVKTLIPGQTIGSSMKGAANRLVVFDNCRNNPADGWRQLEAARGAFINPEMLRNRIERAPNTLVLFSTAPGRVALDGPPGQNSPFCAAFLRQLNDASVDLQSLPSRLRRDILIATEGRQVMWDRNAYAAPFSINGSPRPGSAPDGRSGWGGDPSRIIELPKAYVFAHEHELPVPSGLIAHRPAGNALGAQMTGSFQYLSRTPLGSDPALLLVMSVDPSGTAEIITANKGIHNPKTGKMEGGSIWRFTTANVSGNRLEFVPRDQAARMTFSWSDANSGSFSSLQENATGGGNNKTVGGSTKFTRLDG
jgi:hypothetical protein